MVSYKGQFQPGHQVIQKAESGASHGKIKFRKRLLSITGPQIEIIHIKAFDFNSAIDKKSEYP